MSATTILFFIFFRIGIPGVGASGFTFVWNAHVVAQIGNLPCRRKVFCGPSAMPSTQELFGRRADSQSATQQIANLRYAAVGRLLVRGPAPNRRMRAKCSD